MSETMTRKSGATKKAAKAPEAPVVLADGKTPASPEALRRALGKFELPAEGTTVELVARVRSTLAEKIKAVGHVCTAQCRDDLKSDCPKVICVCEEISVAAPVNPDAPPLSPILQAVVTDFCPFCGDSGISAEEAASAPPLPEAPPTQEEETDSSESPLVGTDSDAPLPSPSGAEIVGTALDEGSGSPSASPGESLPPAPESTDALAPAADAGGTPEVHHGEVLPPEEKDRVPELEESIREIQSLKNNLAENSYSLGEKLREVSEKDLWKARKDPKGHLAYKNWAAWVEAEIGISRSLAHDLVRITREFTRQTFMEVGQTNLRLIASIEDPKARSEALEKAAAGASTREISRIAHDSKKGGEAPPRESRKGKESAPPPEPSKASAPPKKANEITLLAKVDGKPKVHHFTSAKTGKQLKAHAEDAFVEVRLSSNVVQHLALKLDEAGKVVGITVAFIETVEPT